MHYYRIFKVLSASSKRITDFDDIEVDYLPIAFYDKVNGEVTAYEIFERGDNVTLIALKYINDVNYTYPTTTLLGLFVKEQIEVDSRIQYFNELLEKGDFSAIALQYENVFNLDVTYFTHLLLTRKVRLDVLGNFTIA